MSTLGKITYEKVNKGNIDIKDYQVIDVKKVFKDKENLLKLNGFQKELITKLPWRKSTILRKVFYYNNN